MSLKKTEAVVLRSINQGETSKILTLYTRLSGKIAVIAKGARNIKSRYGGNLEPLNYLSIVFYAKENRELHYLSQTELLDAYSSIKRDLTRTSFAMAACELLDRLEAGQEANPLMFRLLISTLRQMNDEQKAANNVFRAFELHVCDIMGFRPHFSDCISCHKKPAGKILFDLSAGGLVCDNCHQPGHNRFILSSESLAVMRRLQQVHISRLNGLINSKNVQKQVDDFLSAFLRYHIEGLSNLKSLKFLAKI